MLKYFLSICFLLPIASLTCYANSLNNIHFMTEEYPPYNFSEYGVAKGVGVDLLLHAFKELGINKGVEDIEVLPWARGYYEVQVPGSQNVLFTMTRNSARESLFQWVGPAFDSEIVVWANKNRHVSIKNINDLANYNYAVVRGDIGGLKLSENDVPQDKIHAKSRFKQIIGFAERGRTCCFVYGKDVALWLMKSLQMNADMYEVAHTFQPSGKMYYAFNLSVNPDSVAKFQAAFDKFLTDPEFMDNIWKPYK